MTTLAEPVASRVPPLVQQLADKSAWVSTDTLDAFLKTPGDAVLFIWSDPVRFPETLDVAVVLPELQKHFSQGGPARFAIGVVTGDSEDAVARRFGAQRRPSLVFVRDGQYVTTVDGMLDWDVYVDQVQQALAAPTRRAPSVGIPVVNGDAGGAACH